METDLLYLDNLDEYINDENRIVSNYGGIFFMGTVTIPEKRSHTFC